ncbi:P22 coat protein-gene protein 5 [Chelatococcus sambhunathii]|uniref:P22 coat protein-gene protein 5 n=1 Tax=Chelatococcus sambhunathii TaxID=363953 RepID=A0ABP2ADS8_9HYPH|nr:P22 phage major capsid protein family protein [Chelatococcus sambhunathii]CUA91003.1 P22 coat protein-gene protein 5 [Chelatococcus sambhunathii]
MSNITPSRLGLVNGSGADDALFLKQFSGEVMTAFAEVNVMMERHLVRTITNAKSASFPATWKASSYYHVPGTELAGQAIMHGERIITIDDLLVSPVFIAQIDEAKNHYDVREIYTKECGYSLANTADRNVLQTAVLAAREAATLTGAPGGSKLDGGADMVTNANSALLNALYLAAQTLDEKDIPEQGRFAVFKPAQYYKLVLDDKAIHRDFTAGNGDIRTGKVFDIAGIQIVKSNHLPTTNIAAPTGSPNVPAGVTPNVGPRPLSKYAGNFADTIGLVMVPNAVGTVKLLDLQVEGEYQINRQGTLIVAKYAMGHGILRPECAVELTKTAP